MQQDTIRAHFPILQEKVHGKPLVYLDNGATTQKPQLVIERISQYYQHENSNVHRGIHALSQEASIAFENARASIQHFIHAAHYQEVLFTKGTTESINLLAHSFGEAYVQAGDEIIVSEMEHHANIVPWQLLCQRKKAILKVIQIDEQGRLNMAHYKQLLSPRTKLVSVAHISNVLGSINPIEDIIALAHQAGAAVHIDGAQAVAHTPLNMQALDVDFYSFSGHKMYAPMGIGILYGKQSYLQEMPPYQSGGEMIQNVSFEQTTFNELPFKFEAGTPNVSGALGLEAAIHFIQAIGLEKIAEIEHRLLSYATQKLQNIPGLRIIGQSPNKSGVLSFVLEGIHPSDAATIIDQMGVAVRSGNHCAQPLIDKYGLNGTIRASFAMYNSTEEVDRLYEAIIKAQQMLG